MKVERTVPTHATDPPEKVASKSAKWEEIE